MSKTYQNELALLIDKYSSAEGLNETAIPGVSCFKATATDMRMPYVYDPSVCIIAQGSKQILLNTQVYRYGPSQYLVASVDLPVIGQITKASNNKPYLCLQITIDLQSLSELLIDTGRTVNSRTIAAPGLFVGKLDDSASDSVLRLARLLDRPDDIPVLAPMMKREIYYRLLCSDYGNTIARIALKGSVMQRIAAVIKTLKSSFDKPVSVESLAELAGMSLSTFHAHFKTVTSMSPLQFQKRLRLTEARQIMLIESADAASTAYRVGYESPSQFSREYARLFGFPPAADVKRFRPKGAGASAQA